MNAVIFPGQSSQYSGMGKSLYERSSVAQKMFAMADEIVGFRLSEQCFFGTDEALKDTSLQQIAILTVSIVAYELFRETGIDVQLVSGLSLGEYSCLYAAGVLGFEDVIRLVQARALAMSQAAQRNPSTMFALLGAERSVVEQNAEKGGYYVSNINSAQQIVVSLAKDTASKVKAFLEGLGIKVIELPVSGGFHSPFMEPAKQQLRGLIERLSFADAVIPVVSNVTAIAHTKGADIQKNLIEQLTATVRWKDGVDYMVHQGVTTFFEVGPSKVLKGLMKKINTSVTVVNIDTADDLNMLEKSKQMNQQG